MGVDHGLGGRDNKKSQEKREKRFKKKLQKSKLFSGEKKKMKNEEEEDKRRKKNKVSLVFDENAREEFLTGFRKRKKERRQFGLAMQVLKDKKALREKKPKLGKLLQQQVDVKEKEVKFDDSDNEDGQDLSRLGKHSQPEFNSNDSTSTTAPQNAVTFTDSETTAMFGGEVSVTVDSNIADQLEESTFAFSGGYSVGSKKKLPTALEKAMKKAKGIMHSKIINKNKHVHIKKGEDKSAALQGKKSKLGAKKGKGAKRGSGKAGHK